MMPVVTGDLVLRKVSSSFIVIQTFGAQLLWYLDGSFTLLSLQPGFANKVILRPHVVLFSDVHF